MTTSSQRLQPVIDLVGGARRPLGRILMWGELRHQLLTALEQLSGVDGSLLSVGDDPRGWIELCQHWRLVVEDKAMRHGALDVTAGVDVTDFVGTVLVGYAAVMQRLENPGLQLVELWCSGQLRRIPIDRPAVHDVDCSCAVFSETVAAATAAGCGVDMWARWADEPSVWIGFRGLLGPHVVRVADGVARPWGGGGPADGRVAWGFRGAGPSRLAHGILVEVLGGEPDGDLADRFAREVVAAASAEHTAAFRFTYVEQWLRDVAQVPRRRFQFGRRRRWR